MRMGYGGRFRRLDVLWFAIRLLTVLPAPPGGSCGAAGAAGDRRAAPPGSGTAPGSDAEEDPRPLAGAAMAWAPVVGLLLGAVAAAVLVTAGTVLRLGPLLSATLAVAALAALTGGLHLDGLADLADGLGSRRNRAGALEIMRRSDIGPFGVVAVTMTLFTQIAALDQAQVEHRGVAALVTATVTGRLALTWACRRGVPAARPDGLGALVAGSVPRTVAVLAIVGVVGAATAGAIAAPVYWQFPAAVAAGVAASVALTAYAVSRLGGVTGDVLGALVETTSAVCLVVVAIH